MSDLCSWGSQGKNTEVVCHSLLQWITFCQTAPPRPIHLGWPYTAWLGFTELDRLVVHVIRLVNFLWSHTYSPIFLDSMNLSSVQFISVAQSCSTLCDPMNRSMPGLPVHHQLPEFTQTHIHRISDAIQPSHPLSSPSPPAPNPSQHQSLFQWVNSSHEVAKVLEFQL